MKEILYYVLAAAAGGFVTSLAEYRFKYNLIASILRLVGGAKMVLVRAEQVITTDYKTALGDVKKVI